METVSLRLKKFTNEELCQDYGLLGYDPAVWYMGVNKVEETVVSSPRSPQS
jgi:hypothetical protein